MSAIYAIHNDGFKYQQFVLELEQYEDYIPDEYTLVQIHSFSYHDIPLEKWWKPTAAKFTSIEGMPDSPKPDVCTWRGTSLVFSQKAYDALKSLVSPFGAFLSISIDDAPYYIFNTRAYGLVDEINSNQLFDGGVFTGVEKLQFNEVDTHDKVLFKSGFNRCVFGFCNSQFKGAVKAANLTGIGFTENLIGLP